MSASPPDRPARAGRSAVSPAGYPGGAARGLALSAVLLYALNLRAPITALAPVVGDVSADLALTPAGAGLLTGIPVLCFAIGTPLASVLLARAGTAAMVTASLTTVLLGTVLRSAGGFATALVGTALIGLAITVGNVAVPVLIGRDFPHQVPRVTGLYTAALNVGSVLTTLFTAPLAGLIGWRWALAAWGVMAVGATFVWLRAYGVHDPGEPPVVGAAADPDAADTSRPPVHVLRRPVTWLLAVAFSGQAFGYYAVSAWLPSILHDQLGLAKASAGAAAALFQLFGVLGGVGVPLALGRRVPVRVVSSVIAAGWVVLPLGLLLAPQAWPVWCALAGTSQGGNFAVIFTVVAQSAGSQAAARRMSATVQTVGYGCAALGPSVMGAVHSATSTWVAPLLVVLAGLLVMAACSQLALVHVRRDATASL
ncbi:MFS transporter [Cellulomonas soli]|uniref:MFS transporter n=1 Tax=Cellulomonas soli TaxID=931535 RepID=A0A512PGZ0_9CELL|nr:MFS transporter [Cellulomonas soli]NYI59684.1 CP family cyanate transporter-like MFS transporter [Cellulomonas soli]GEP70478.1 MFS transporter [Cellulomonas soli]